MLDTLICKFMDWQQRRLAISKLQTLDDRLLADLGTTREDIVCFVAGHGC